MICAMVVSSCKDKVLIPAQDAEHTGIFRSPSSGKYSEYIISPEKAIEMVANDLKRSGSEFAGKQISHVETVIIEGIRQMLSEDLFEEDFILLSAPAFYIVHLKNEGYMKFFLYLCNLIRKYEIF